MERAYRGDSARAGWTHEADLLTDERTSDAELEANLSDADTRVLLADRDGALLGTVTIQRAGEGRAYLGMFAVDPQVQAGGIGKALLAVAEDEAARSFAAHVMEMTVISARPELIAWYERRGYCQSGEVRPFPADHAEGRRLTMLVLEKALG